MTGESLLSPVYNLESEILDNWNTFCLLTQSIIINCDDASTSSSYFSNFQSCVSSFCKYGNGLRSLVEDHFLLSLQGVLEKHGALNFWKNFDGYSNVSDLEMDDKDVQEDEVELLCKALEEISQEKQYQKKRLLMFVNSLQLCQDNNTSMEGNHSDVEKVLHRYFKGRLEELSTIIVGDDEDTYVNHSGNMDIDGSYNYMKTLENIRMVVHNLRNLGLTSMTEDAYASAIFLLLKAKVYDLAGDEYRNSVLESIKNWIQAVPLQFLHELLDYLGDSISYFSPPSTKSPLASCPSSGDKPSKRITRWQLRLEYFAYETLQELRIAKLFEIIGDYPDSVPAIYYLKQCLEYTGQHSKLVDSFKSSMRYRLLTAGASTNDILDQYVSTIKALRTIDPTRVFLKAVGEPIWEYLRGRKDTVKWEPDPIGAAPFMGSRYRRKVDVLVMIVSIIVSKDQLINEYRVMLAEKLLNQTNYDIDTEIRTLELLKLELEFEDIMMQFTVTPVHATIIMKFQEQTSWTSKSLAATIRLPVDTLQRRVNFCISKEMIADDDAKRSMASVEDQLRKEMVVYEMLCFDPAYNKSLQQLQRFLSSLAAKEKIELRGVTLANNCNEVLTAATDYSSSRKGPPAEMKTWQQE
uniref:Anaphase-promoting complex subunit 2 n=1 Tax=Tanacetum cinerariifolium TaxID=118510 RepID=A0A699GRM5_TANCI|nr:anaphase-promoting complex subunit 2 [Tanacetum cinerariifolium]